jgi:putative glutamine amidotransferase
MSRLPVVGISCDRRKPRDQIVHFAGEEYVLAVRDGAGALPLLVPVPLPPLPVQSVLASVDGLLFMGSPSNVAPQLYGGEPPRPGTMLDEARDATSMPLLRAAIEAGLPVLCICRGFQELNVALGGTLHQHIAEVAGFHSHEPKDGLSIDEDYAPAHSVTLREGGVLARLLGKREFRVNSLHGQGVAALAPGLAVEARADDGVIEAVSLPGAKGFLLGVQWHPEWRFREDPVSTALFAAFGAAARNYSEGRGRTS